MSLPNNTDQTIYPITTNYMESIYFINSTLKGNSTSISSWVIDQISQAIPSRFKTMPGFESALKLFAQHARPIATKILHDDNRDVSGNKQETADDLPTVSAL